MFVGKIDNMLTNKMDLHCEPKNEQQQWALGYAFKMVHDGINNCHSEKSILRNYNHALGVLESIIR